MEKIQMEDMSNGGGVLPYLSFTHIYVCSRKRADGMGSELGPEHDHNMDPKSMRKKQLLIKCD